MSLETTATPVKICSRLLQTQGALQWSTAGGGMLIVTTVTHPDTQLSIGDHNSTQEGFMVVYSRE